MQISVSHNPKEYNGVKFVKARAFPVGYDNGINEIEKRVKENRFKDVKKKGKVKTKKNILDDQVKFALTFVDIKKIKPFKIVADAANAMGSLYLDKLFYKLKCKLIKMNFKLDGNFPAHQADPFQEKNRKDIVRILQGKEKGAKTDLVAINAGASLYSLGDVKTLKEGTKKAQGILSGGTGYEIIKRLISDIGSTKLLEKWE